MNEAQFLALLSAQAPKIEQWGVNLFDEQFEKDYPMPWAPDVFSKEFADACTAAIDESMKARSAACKKYYGTHQWSEAFFAMGKHQSISRYGFIGFEQRDSWSYFREEKLNEFARSEWPFIWAKKRMLEATRETT